MIKAQPVITVLGGGTGSFTLLKELKHVTPHITAVVNMSDDGGSSGRLREEFDVLPPGDARQCLVALSNEPELNEIFGVRFGGDGALRGHHLGNLILSGLEVHYGDFNKALQAVSRLLNITGRVVPVTVHKSTLMLSSKQQTLRGEYTIVDSPIIDSANANVWLEPPGTITKAAAKAIAAADLLVIAPGNLYGSLLPICVVDGVAEAINKSSAKRILVTNLVNKPGQTDGWHVVDYVKQFERYLGPGSLDYVLYNLADPSPELLRSYAAEGELPVEHGPERFSEISLKPIGAQLLAKRTIIQDDNDALPRTLIRHDAVEVGRQLLALL